MTDQLSLAILEGDDDVVLIKNPFCEKCAKTKLKTLFFCKISDKDAQELVKLYKMSQEEAIDYMFPEAKTNKKGKGKNIGIRLINIKCECECKIDK
jgi:hypothetical protein